MDSKHINNFYLFLVLTLHALPLYGSILRKNDQLAMRKVVHTLTGNASHKIDFRGRAVCSSVPHFDHIVVVIEENHSFNEIMGNSSAPYINQLAQNGVKFTQSFAVTHPSQPNYLALFAGSTFGITDDNNHGQFSAANLASELINAQKTFIGYSEAPAVRKHNPWVQFSNLNPVITTINQDFTAFQHISDYSTLPSVSFVVPNLNDDAHDGSVAAADTWLHNNLDNYAQWSKTHNSLLIVTFDEDDGSANNNIPTLFYGAHVTTGLVTAEHITHYDVLHTMEDSFGLPHLNASAHSILDVWDCSSVPVAPVLNAITVNPATPSNYTVSWNSVANATSYTLQQSTTSNFASPTTVAQGNVLSQAFVNQPNGTYFYRVLASSASGNSPFSNVHSVTINVPPVPVAPVLNAITVNPATPSNYTVSWNSVANATSYTLQQSTTSNFASPTTVAQGNVLSQSFVNQPNGTYFYRVLASNASGNSPFSNVQSVTINVPVVPVAPVLNAISVNQGTPSNYIVSWNSVANATSYTLQQSTTSNFASPITVAQGNVLSQAFVNQPNGTYFYRVLASNASGNSPFSNVQSVTINVPPVPVAPVLNAISVNPATPRNYTVSWNSVANATSYTLQQSTTSNFASPTTVVQGNVLSQAFVNQPNGTYFYRVLASNASGNSPFSNVQNVTINAPPVPVAPVLNAITVNPSTPSNYTVSWNSVANATSYTLQQSTTSNFASPTTVAQGNVLSQAFVNQPNGTYYYRVLASNAGGNSPFSNVQNVTINVQIPVPVAPILNPIPANPVTPSNYTVSWNSVVNATSYTLQQSTTSDFSNPITVAQGNILSQAFVNQPNGIYVYRVLASNSSGNSPFSNVQCIVAQTPVPVAPVLNPISVNPATPSNYTVSWNSVANATSYTLQQSTTSNFASPTTVAQGNVLSQAFVNQPNGTYYYRVLASNAGGNSPFSNVQNVVINASGLSTFGNHLINSSGQIVRIKGINWWGFESPSLVVHGLSVRNYKSVMDQIKSLGFNTIRLPYCNQMFQTGNNPQNINYSLNPDLNGLTSIQILDKMIQYADTIGLFIILDHHRSEAGYGSEGNGLWYTANYPVSVFINDWKMLVSRYINNPSVIGVDLHNEPHGTATWGTGSATDWRAAATNIGNIILSINPKLLIIVEGIAVYQNNYYWWGGQLMQVNTLPVTLNVSNKLVYSPHDYPNSIYPQSWFSDPNYPNNLPAVFTKAWGFIFAQNIAPVILGEFGSKFIDPKDSQWMQQITSYLNNNLPTNPNGISWMWWSLNPDSVDTGGLLLSDWQTPDPVKLAKLAPLLQ